MSEFQKSQKIATNIEMRLLEGNLGRTELEGFKETIERKLFPVCEKYAVRMSEKDPVTGEPRLGPTMIGKVVKFKELVEKISEMMTQKLEVSLPLCQNFASIVYFIVDFIHSILFAALGSRF